MTVREYLLSPDFLRVSGTIYVWQYYVFQRPEQLDVCDISVALERYGSRMLIDYHVLERKAGAVGIMIFIV